MAEFVVWAQVPAPGGLTPMLRFEVSAPDEKAAFQHIRLQLGFCAQAAMVDPEQGEMIFVSEDKPCG